MYSCVYVHSGDAGWVKKRRKMSSSDSTAAAAAPASSDAMPAFVPFQLSDEQSVGGPYRSQE